jgi:PrtD family type I secretion system ABC transporter
MHSALRQRWFAKHRHFLSLQVNASESAGVIGGLNAFLTHAMPSLQMALAVWLAVGGLISGGMVMVASYLINFSVQPIVKVMTSWPQIQAARMALERLNSMLAEDQAHQNRMTLPAPKGRLDVGGLLAQPPGARKPILLNIQFNAQPGWAVAIMGPSASGKTSLVKHLVGIWEPLRGHARLDGADIAPWIRDDLGRQIGYVPQDIELFDGTVAENIARMGEPDADQVVEAAKATGIHELVLSFPKGYDTVIGQGGHSLTGGQKQRIAIARAIYGNPTYVVMDEPNSNLDEESEKALVLLVQALRLRNTTVIFTTHRPKLLAIASHIVVLKDGQQVTFGPVQDVLMRLKLSAPAVGGQEAGAPAQAAEGVAAPGQGAVPEPPAAAPSIH